MKITVYKCDHCKAEIGENNGGFSFTSICSEEILQIAISKGMSEETMHACGLEHLSKMFMQLVEGK